jgi:hypothetical protein
MPPRRERQSPDPEDREVRRRGRPTWNLEMERQIQDLRVRLKRWKQIRDAQLVQGILVISTMRLKLNHKEKLQLRMQQMSD